MTTDLPLTSLDEQNPDAQRDTGHPQQADGVRANAYLNPNSVPGAVNVEVNGSDQGDIPDDLPTLSRTSGSAYFDSDTKRQEEFHPTGGKQLHRNSSDPLLAEKKKNQSLKVTAYSPAMGESMRTLGQSLKAPPSLTPTLDKQRSKVFLDRAEDPNDNPLVTLTAYEAFETLPVELMNSQYGDVKSKSMAWSWVQGIKNTTILLAKVNLIVLFLASVLGCVLLYKQFIIYQEGELQRRHHEPEVAVRGFADAAVLTTALAWTPYLYILVMFGYKNTLPVLKYWIPLVSIAMLSNWTFIFVMEWQGVLDLGTAKTLPAFLLCSVSVFVCAHFMYKKHKIERIRSRFIVATGSVVIVSLLYFFILPPLWFSAEKPFMKFLIRIIAHPLVFEIAGFSMRWVTRSMTGNHPASTWIVMVMLFTFSGIYGRFLVAAMDSTQWTLITAIVLSLEEIFLRLSVGARDKWLFARLKTQEAAMQRFRTVRALRLRSDLLYIDIIIENTSIIIAGITLYVFRSNIASEASAVDVSVERIVTDIFLQLALEWITDTIVLSIEVRQFHIPVPEAFETKLNFLRSHSLRWLYFLGSLVFITASTYSYIVTAYFDPRVGFLKNAEVVVE